jgi:hypothetical protein
MGRSWGLFVAVLAGCFGFSATARAQALQPQPLVPPPNSGHFEVSLHARSLRASARSEQVAWLTVTLPLERLALPKVTRPTLVEAPAPASPQESPPTADPPAPRPALLTLEQLRALSEFSRRASAIALSVAGAGADRSRLDSLSSRARSSALLPELRLRAVRNTDRALRLVPTTDDPYRVTQADGAGLILEVSATFRLDRLVFAHEELMVERLRIRAGAERLKLEARVQGAVQGLFRARQLACAAPPEDPARQAQITKTLEFFQELDTLTAGWFSAQASALGNAVWGFPEAILGACEPPEPPKPPAVTKAVASLEDSE